MSENGKKKIVVFLRDGIIEDVYAQDPDLDLTIISYDRDLDDKDALDELYEKCEKDPELERYVTTIIHPKNQEEVE